MKREKLLWIGIVILGVLNIACLAFMILGKRDRPNRKFDRLIIESLALDNTQIEKFDQLKRKHHQQILDLDEQLKEPFNKYFSLLKGNRDTLKEDSIKSVISGIYEKKVEITYLHFAELKAICSEEQQKNMDKVIPFLMQVISPQKNVEPSRGK